MKAEVIGYRPVDFKDPESGKQITGISVYVVSPMSGNGAVGSECIKHFLSSWAKPFTGSCDLIFNLRGKVIDIVPAKI